MIRALFRPHGGGGRKATGRLLSPRWSGELKRAGGFLLLGGGVGAAMSDRGERLLAACDEPFWGRPGKPNPHPKDRLYRRTEREEGEGVAKSVFQIGGAGAVGTGSIRGMPHLLTLSALGFAVWPFAEGGWPRVVEIYPRLLTGPVNKGRWAERHAFLLERFPGQPRDLLERAAGFGGAV